MSPTIKRALLIIGLLATAALIGFGLYYLFVRKAPGVVVPAKPPIAPGQLPAAGKRIPAAPVAAPPGAAPALPTAGAIPTAAPSYYRPTPVSKVSSDYATYTSLKSDGGLRYQNALDGKFYKIMPDGTIKEMTDQIFYNVSNVTWAKNKDKAVLEYPDGSKIVYNFETKKQVTLPKHWQEFSFSPDSNEIAAKSLGLSPENRWLVTVADDGTNTKLIEPMGDNANRVKVDWSPSRQTVAFSQTGQPMGADRREVLFIGLNGENFKSTVVEGLDFVPQWSTTGKKLLYSVDSARSDFKPELWIVSSYGDDIGSDRQMLQLNTWANKCAFADDNTLYCAVPRDLPRGAGMSPEIAAGTYDDMYKIDLKTGLKTNLSLGADNYQVNSISFDTAHNKVLFTASNQQGVFEVKM